MHIAAKQHENKTLALKIPSNAMSVRKALCQVLALDLPADTLAVAEIVLAEVMNNIVEHAFQERLSGWIEVSVTRTDHVMNIEVRDDGVPLPHGLLDQKVHHDLDCPIGDLPEGGFGWPLVQELTDNLRYERADHRNILTFSIAISDDKTG